MYIPKRAEKNEKKFSVLKKIAFKSRTKNCHNREQDNLSLAVKVLRNTPNI